MNTYLFNLLLRIYNEGLRVKSHFNNQEYPYALITPEGDTVKLMRERTFKLLHREGLLHCGRLTQKAIQILLTCKQ